MGPGDDTRLPWFGLNPVPDARCPGRGEGALRAGTACNEKAADVDWEGEEVGYRGG